MKLLRRAKLHDLPASVKFLLKIHYFHFVKCDNKELVSLRMFITKLPENNTAVNQILFEFGAVN